MALVDKIGNQYRMMIGTSDHHEMWQMLPEGWAPGEGDEVVGEVPPPEPPPEEALAPAQVKKTKR
jgi:hypothetical protein